MHNKQIRRHQKDISHGMLYSFCWWMPAVLVCDLMITTVIEPSVSQCLVDQDPY